MRYYDDEYREPRAAAKQAMPAPAAPAQQQATSRETRPTTTRQRAQPRAHYYVMQPQKLEQDLVRKFEELRLLEDELVAQRAREQTLTDIIAHQELAAALMQGHALHGNAPANQAAAAEQQQHHQHHWLSGVSATQPAAPFVPSGADAATQQQQQAQAQASYISYIARLLQTATPGTLARVRAMSSNDWSQEHLRLYMQLVMVLERLAKSAQQTGAFFFQASASAPTRAEDEAALIQLVDGGVQLLLLGMLLNPMPLMSAALAAQASEDLSGGKAGAHGAALSPDGTDPAAGAAAPVGVGAEAADGWQPPSQCTEWERVLLTLSHPLHEEQLQRLRALDAEVARWTRTAADTGLALTTRVEVSSLLLASDASIACAAPYGPNKRHGKKLAAAAATFVRTVLHSSDSGNDSSGDDSDTNTSRGSLRFDNEVGSSSAGATPTAAAVAAVAAAAAQAQGEEDLSPGRLSTELGRHVVLRHTHLVLLDMVALNTLSQLQIAELVTASFPRFPIMSGAWVSAASQLLHRQQLLRQQLMMPAALADPALAAQHDALLAQEQWSVAVHGNSAAANGGAGGLSLQCAPQALAAQGQAFMPTPTTRLAHSSPSNGWH